VYRTDLVFKHEFLRHSGFSNLIPTRKLPEYVPARALKLHALMARKVELPEQLIKELETFYPEELSLYYKDVYKNLCSHYNIPERV